MFLADRSAGDFSAEEKQAVGIYFSLVAFVDQAHFRRDLFVFDVENSEKRARIEFELLLVKSGFTRPLV